MQLSNDATIRPFRPADAAAVHGLLEHDGLPREGLDAPATRLWVADASGRVVAAIGLEVHGPWGLLRSAVVEPGRRGEGLGTSLTATVLEAARETGLLALYLLTTTAEGYFPRFGFVRVPRSDVPEALFASEELRGACPESAVVMRWRP